MRTRQDKPQPACRGSRGPLELSPLIWADRNSYPGHDTVATRLFLDALCG